MGIRERRIIRTGRTILEIVEARRIRELLRVHREVEEEYEVEEDMRMLAEDEEGVDRRVMMVMIGRSLVRRAAEKVLTRWGIVLVEFWIRKFSFRQLIVSC